MKSFSIIIPTYNQQDFVADAIQSALDQTVPCEVIVINDGSTDNSLEVINSFKDKVKVIDQNNKGLPSARNTGIMNATGDYILPLDSDDILEDHCVEVLQQVAEMHTDADVIAPSFKSFGVAQGDIILMPNPTIEDFKTANRIAYCSAVKRETLLKLGGYSPRMFWGYEDFALWIDLLKRGGKIVTIPEKLWLYRTKNESMLTEALKHHEELINRIIFDNKSVYEQA